MDLRTFLRALENILVYLKQTLCSEISPCFSGYLKPLPIPHFGEGWRGCSPHGPPSPTAPALCPHPQNPTGCVFPSLSAQKGSSCPFSSFLNPSIPLPLGHDGQGAVVEESQALMKGQQEEELKTTDLWLGLCSSVGKEPLVMQETLFNSWSGRSSLEKGTASLIVISSCLGPLQGRVGVCLGDYCIPST